MKKERLFEFEFFLKFLFHKIYKIKFYCKIKHYSFCSFNKYKKTQV